MTYQENYQKWVDFADLPDYLRQDLENMDEKTKEDAFYTNLEFGTAGMRGLIGAGTNRINIYVVRQATEGLARLIESKGGNEKERGVAIAYDSRHFSPEQIAGRLHLELSYSPVSCSTIYIEPYTQGN